MKHFVLFSMILIVASVIVLLMPPNDQEQEQEGFEPMPEMARREGFGDIINQMGQGSAPPIPTTFFRESSITAAAADGTSDQDHLLHKTLKKHESLFETFATKSNMDQQSVSATTTKKNGIASHAQLQPVENNHIHGTPEDITEPFEARSAFKNPDISVPVGCSKKCVQIKNKSDAIGGNCVNPPISKTNKPDYSKKYCPAFRVPDGDYSMREQECATCGYYTYAANCTKFADPKNPNKCTLYGSYDYESPSTGTNDYINCKDNDAICNLFHGVGGTNAGGDDGTTTTTSLTCSKDNCPPKQVTVAGNKCVIPGCISMDDGMLPQPKDFYGNDRINPCMGKGQNIKCPAITSGSEFKYGAYNSVSGNDACYTTNGKPDKTKFQSMNQVPICNQVKPISQQNFVPVIQQQGQSGQGTQSTQNQGTQGTQGTQGQSGQGTQGQNTQGTQAINVYHHAGRSKKSGYMSTSSSDSSTYIDPVPGTLYLGIF